MVTETHIHDIIVIATGNSINASPCPPSNDTDYTIIDKIIPPLLSHFLQMI